MKNIFVIIALISMLSCTSTETSEKAGASENDSQVSLTLDQAKSIGIVTQKVEKRKISTSIRLNGVIDVPPQNMISVSMPLGGYLKSTHLLPGMKVKRGEVIATMEDQLYVQIQQDYLTAISRLSYLENEYKRQLDLNESKAVSDKTFQSAKMEFESQKIQTKALEEKLKLIHLKPELVTEASLSRTINLYSPIEGFVTKVNVNIGKYLSPTDVLFELVNPSDIHLNLTVFERDLQKLSIGQEVTAFTNNNPEKKFPCEIILISKSLSIERAAEVHCHFEEYDESLLPGMYMNALVELANEEKLTLPEDAIVSFEGESYLFVETATNTFEMKKVSTGATENGFVEVLNVQDLISKSIVSKGAYTLLMVMKNKSND